MLQTIHVKRVGRVTVIGFSVASLDHRSAIDLERTLRRAKTADVVVNLHGVVHWSSETLNALIQGSKHLAGIGGHVHLCLVDDQLREKLRVLHLEDSIFPVYESEPDAIMSFESARPPVTEGVEVGLDDADK